MKKAKRLKYLIITLLFVFGINNFAAIVSDNDGSAFVTKAEFDALKNSFNEQINNYNNSIDGKIDGAIASYLAGMKLSTEEEVEILVAGPKEAMYYEDDEMVYDYTFPAWDCSISGYQIDWGTGRHNTVGSVKTLNLTTQIKVDDTDFGTKELTVTKSPSGKPQSYIWNGYFTNVKWAMKSDSIEDYVTCDGGYYNIKWSQTVGPVFSLAAGDYTSTGYTNNNKFRRCILWSYNTRNKQTKNGAEWYGPYNCNHTSVCTNTVSVSYKDDSRNTKDNGAAEWDKYVIGFSEQSKHCNLYNNILIFGDGSESNEGKNSSKKMTDTWTNFANKQMIVSGNTNIVYQWGSAGSNDIAVYSNSFSKYAGSVAYDLSAESETYYKSYDGNTYLSVPGGLGKVSSYNIRQKKDGLENQQASKTLKLENLSLLAGLPVCIEKKDTKLIWNLEFLDKTKNYKVWLSYEPFDTNYSAASGGYKGEPNDDLDLVDITCNGKTDKSAVIKNGIGSISWTMKDTLPVYLKWAITDGATPEKLTVSGARLNLEKCSKYIRILDR